jgi:hypothetical protein
MNQKQRVLAYLKRNKSITQMQAFTEIGVMRLSERVRELEAEGAKIKHVRARVHDRFGDPCYVTRYYYKG